MAPQHARNSPVNHDELGLLDSIAQGALDDDYYEVRSGRYSRSRGLGTAITGITMLIFALLVTIAAVQTRTLKPAAQADRSTLIADIQSSKDSLADRQITVRKLTTAVALLEVRSSSTNPTLRQLRTVTGAVAVSGQGISVVLNPSESEEAGAAGQVSANDLQAVVNALWSAGAEAISVNGQRLTTLSSIHKTGTAIAVNYRSISPPYVVLALGNRVMLEQQFRTSVPGKAVIADAKKRTVRLDIEPYEMIEMVAAPDQRLTTLNATVSEDKK
ncbi:DUF881 domain-containing protein [soil metagenome]